MGFARPLQTNRRIESDRIPATGPINPCTNANSAAARVRTEQRLTEKRREVYTGLHAQTRQTPNTICPRVMVLFGNIPWQNKLTVYQTPHIVEPVL